VAVIIRDFGFFFHVSCIVRAFICKFPNMRGMEKCISHPNIRSLTECKINPRRGLAR